MIKWCHLLTKDRFFLSYWFGSVQPENLKMLQLTTLLIPVLRIHDILVWIRIRGSMPLTNGSRFGSGSGCASLYFHHWPSRCQHKNKFKNKVFLHITFWRYFYIIFQRSKDFKKSQNSRNQGFSYYFCLMIEGSGSESGSVPLTNGSRRPKITWIRWIRIRIRIHNTGLYCTVIVWFRDQWKKEKRQRLAAARESALSNEQAMIESRLGQSFNQTFLRISIKTVNMSICN